MPTDPPTVLVAIDGDCLLCNRSAGWIAGHDHHDRIRFTRLEDPAGKAMLAELGENPPDSMLVSHDGHILTRADAVAVVARALPLPWSIAGSILRFVPFRNRVYEFIAKRRYDWFGKNDSCELPPEALRRRLVE
jgi:predicted DCC family thiol-disulfide oxidoreductase YuxK